MIKGGHGQTNQLHNIHLQSPSKQNFYRQITGYGVSIGDRRVA